MGDVSRWAMVGLLGLAGPAGASVRQDEATGEAIAGTFRNNDDGGKPVAGVDVVVRDDAGKEIGTATSDDEGKYELELPGPGAYTAELQTDSLPKGVNLTDAKRTKLSFSVNPSQRKPLIFPFGKDTRVTVSTLDKIPGTHRNSGSSRRSRERAGVGVAEVIDRTGSAPSR